MSAFTQIDLSKLPAPNVVSEPDFEQTLSNLKFRLTQAFPPAADVLDLESEPLVKFLEIVAYELTLHRSMINQQARAVLLATASGADLDNLAAIIPLTRNTGESDAEFRARIQLAPEAFSTAGPSKGYEFHTKAAHQEITDVYVTSPVPGHVDVYVLTKQDVVGADVLADVIAALTSDSVRPLTDQVSVHAFSPVNFHVIADIVVAPGPDSAEVLSASIAALETYLAGRRKFGRDINRAGLLSALYVPGVENVLLSSPVADVVIADHEVAIESAAAVVGVDNG